VQDDSPSVRVMIRRDSKHGMVRVFTQTQCQATCSNELQNLF